MQPPPQLLFNWKQTINPAIIQPLLKLVTSSYPKTSRSVGLVVAYPVWKQLMGCTVTSKFMVIAQNFTQLAPANYLAQLTTYFQHNQLAGVLLNHPEQPESATMQRQVIKLAHQYQRRLFYCFGNTIKLQTTISAIVQQLTHQLAQLRLLLPTTLQINLVLEPLQQHKRATLIRQFHRQLNQIATDLRPIIQNYFGSNWTLMVGGGLNVTNLQLLPAFDGFMLGQASLDPVQVKQLLT